MPSIIRVLDEQTINKIAAGEVIENPASVVKELVENAIDAGSTEIIVEIRGGGRQMIRITDNGCGMNADDALLCLERHATSKIRAVEDIDALLTMGFRGEAIPSIASISKFMLLTCPQGSDVGTMVLVEGGKVMGVNPAVRSPGTTIEVKSLFFNVPVRRKFQKAPNQDANDILKVLSLLALGNPAIKFQLTHNESLLLQTSAASNESFLDNLQVRIGDVLGDQLDLKAVEAKKEQFAVQGFVGSPSVNRPNRTGQYTFINKRGVFSPLIAHFVKEAYGTMLPTGRYPVFVLHLTLPEGWVDPNVHPQKREVRLRHEQELRALILDGIGKALSSILAWSSPQVEEPRVVYTVTHTPYTLPKTLPWENTPALPKEAAGPTPWLKSLQVETVSEREFQTELPVVAHPTPAMMRVIATMPRYLLAENNGWTLIDQHAAHSRILFEEFQKGSDKAIQSLLIPLTFEFTPHETALLREALPTLNALGLPIKEFHNTFIVDGIPQSWGELHIADFIREALHIIEEAGHTASMEEEFMRRLAASAARASVGSTRKMTLLEAQNLINRLQQCAQPNFCPAGKRTYVPLEPQDLSKFFKV